MHVPLLKSINNLKEIQNIKCSTEVYGIVYLIKYT